MFYKKRFRALEDAVELLNARYRQTFSEVVDLHAVVGKKSCGAYPNLTYFQQALPDSVLGRLDSLESLVGKDELPPAPKRLPTLIQRITAASKKGK